MTEGVTELLRVGILQPSLGHPHAEEQAVEKDSRQSFCRTSAFPAPAFRWLEEPLKHHHQSDSSTPPAVLSA
jgi:hypothetical protein